MRGVPLLLGAVVAAFVGLSGPTAVEAEARTVCTRERECFGGGPPTRIRECRVFREPGFGTRRICETRIVRRLPQCTVRRVCRAFREII